MEPDIDNFADILLDSYDIDEDVEQPVRGSEPPTENQEEAPATTTKKAAKLKLDEDLLLDGKGLTLLKTETQHLKFKGKGHEDEDLKKLMTYYTVWANNLYPKFKFQDFAQKVGKAASSKRVRVVLDTWKDEYIERRNIRLGLRQDQPANNWQDEAEEERRQEEEESSEDDNRPLFFPITTPLPTKKQPKKKKNTAPAQEKPSTSTRMDEDDSEDDDEPLFRGGIKRKMASASMMEEDEPVVEESRESALARLAKKRKEREIAKHAEELKRKEKELEQTAIGLEKPKEDSIMEEFDVELALSDSELEILGVK